jgi:dUTP pyrophosphatase
LGIRKLIFETMSIAVKIVNTSANALPEYATEGSAGLDLRANLTEAIELKPMERRLIPTGLFIELPMGYEAQVRPRSGLAVKHGLTCLNSPGTVDSDYRGELKVLLINLSGEMQIIHHGDRIAQMVVQKFEKISWKPVETLSQTARNEGGFGSTGKN